MAGLIRREARRTAVGDWNSNIYHLNGLVARIQAIEPEFTAAQKEAGAAQKEAGAAQKRAETPAGRRGMV